VLEDAHQSAFRKAAQLLKDHDPREIGENRGAEYADMAYRISYFGESYTIALPDCGFAPPQISLSERVLVLHYLVSGGCQSETWDHVTYRSLPGGAFYYPVYRKRGADRILHAFGGSPESLLSASKVLGAKPASFGDVSVTVPVLPKIEAVIVLNRGDDEFPPEAQVLYRDDIVNFLSLEDIAFLAGALATRLIRSHQSGS
jgi:hypothetical protein